MTDFQPRFRQCLHTAVRARHSQLQLAKAENLAKFNATPATQCRSNRVSRRRLPETGIFQISARDYRRFLPGRGHIWSLETDRQFAKACHWRAFLALPRAKSQSAGLVGWGGRIRTSAWWNQNPLPYHLATPQSCLESGGTGSAHGFLLATPVYRGSRAISTGQSLFRSY
jgi:hypothetical protein